MRTSIGQKKQHWMHNPYKYVPTAYEICVNTRRNPSSSPWRSWLSRWLPVMASAPTAPPRAEAPHRGGDNTAKDQRLRRTARREHLYAVVRENMIRVGVLSGAYKFKVLTLDHDGLSHVVLIDIQPGALDRVSGAEGHIELSLQQLAQERLGLEVKSVYWRHNGPMVAGPAPVTAPPPGAVGSPGGSTGHEAVGADELAALEQALDASHNGLWDARRPEFEPTRPMPRSRDKGFTPLSDTQLGDLD